MDSADPTAASGHTPTPSEEAWVGSEDPTVALRVRRAPARHGLIAFPHGDSGVRAAGGRS